MLFAGHMPRAQQPGAKGSIPTAPFPRSPAQLSLPEAALNIQEQHGHLTYGHTCPGFHKIQGNTAICAYTWFSPRGGRLSGN